MYIVTKHSLAGTILLAQNNDFNAILDEMKRDMEYAYLQAYGDSITLKNSAQFDDIGLLFRTEKPCGNRPIVTGYLNDIYNDGKITEYTWDMFQISTSVKKGTSL